MFCFILFSILQQNPPSLLLKDQTQYNHGKIPTTLFYIQKKLLNLSADSAKLSREIKIAQTLSDNSEKASNMRKDLETFCTNQRYIVSQFFENAH